MNRLLIKTSMPNWSLEFNNLLKLQKPITIINDGTLNDDDFISGINKVINSFTLKPWHNIIRKILLILLPLLALSFIFAFVHTVILEIGFGFPFLKVTGSTSSFILGILGSLYAAFKLLKAKKPISNMDGKAITIAWEKY